MLFRLNDNDHLFPDPSLADEDGLLAIGGDLTVERLTAAYAKGIFPWFSENSPICWFSPPERCVLYPEKVFISKSMQKLLNRKVFTITFNKAFAEVISNCRNTYRDGQPGTWITADMEAAYNELHACGKAMSVEVWQDDLLCGGLYGVVVGDIFCGESMFSKVSNSSKAALIYLSKSEMFKLIDCQMPTAHLMSMGAELISRQQFLNILPGKI